jgi:hypothetical protein
MDSKYSDVEKESIGPWWICDYRRRTLDDAFVYTFGAGLFGLVETSLRKGGTNDLSNYFWCIKCSGKVNTRRFGLSSVREAFEFFNHSYQVGDGLRVHLVHCPAALDLDGILCGSKLISNLFV